MPGRQSRRVFRPSAQNRPEAVDAIWQEVRDSLPHFEKLLASSSADLDYDLRERSMAVVGVSCYQQFDLIMTLAVGAIWQGKAEGAELLRQALALMYWGAEITREVRMRERIGYDVRDTTLFGWLWMHGLAAGGNAPEIAEWGAPYLFNFLRTGDGDGGKLELAVDVPFRLFFHHLMRAQVEERWSADVDRRAMRAYGDLVATAGGEEFKRALVDFCDYRVAQALRFDGLDAPKRRSAAVSRSILDIEGWIRLFPVELFSLKYVYERTTGKPLSLEAGHPLLSSPLMKMPALLPPYKDQLLARVEAAASEVFGGKWAPLSSMKSSKVF